MLLLSHALNQLKKMKTDFKRCTKKVGLTTHPEKRSILPTRNKNKQRKAQVDNISVDILPPNVKAKYLGQTITFEQQERVEITKAESGTLGHRLPLTAKS